MRCLFCKQDSSSTKSIEHIIPESLGNTTLILPRGYVCDKCNNYFARKVEKKFMDLDVVKLWRLYEKIPNKIGRMPAVECTFNDKKTQICIEDSPLTLTFHIMNDSVFNAIKNTKGGHLYIPVFTDNTKFESNIYTSRLLAKIALEYWAYCLKDIENSLNEIIDDVQYDLIRNYARLGTPYDWPCSIRRIYGMYEYEIDSSGCAIQKKFECDFLIIKEGKIGNAICATVYFILVIRGIEFVINLTYPEIDGYYDWLEKHNGISKILNTSNT